MQVLGSSYPPVRAGQRGAQFYKLAGLLVAVTITTAAWGLALLLAGHAIGIKVSAPFLAGFALAIAAVSCVGIAAVITDR